MNVMNILAVLLIVVGVLSLVYGKFSYTRATHDASLGPVKVSVKDKETINVPVWFGAASIAVGAALLLVL